MYWCHYYNLLGRIHLLQLRHGDVDTTFQGVLIHGKMAMATLNHFAWLVKGYSYAVESLRVPFADRHTIVIIVGTHKDKDGIEIIAMLFLELICLAGNVVPLSAAYTINVWGDAEPILQESPVFHFRSLDVRIGDGVTEVSHFLSFPRMLKVLESLFFFGGFFLAHRFLGEGGHGWHRQSQGECQGNHCLFLHC